MGAEIVIPVKDILSGEDDTNYTKAKASVRGLMGKFLEYEDDSTYKATHILNDVDVDKISGKMVIQVNKKVWDAMLDFSKGFRKYELETATKLRGKYSLRIYKLVSKQTQPITYLIEDLRKMWGLTEKYKKVDDFVKNTIVAAKEELDRVSPYSFDYVLNSAKTAEVNKGRKGRPAITSVTFFPIHRMNNESTDAVRKSVDPSMMLDRMVSDLLRNKLGFDWQGIKANISLFDIAQKQFDLFTFLNQVAPKALRAVNPQGYVINAIKKHLSEHYGIVIEGGIILQDKKIAKKANKGRKGRPAITSVTFFPIHRMNNESTDAVRKSVDPSMMLDRMVSDLLRNKLGFDWQGIKANISLFDIAQKQFDLFTFLNQVAPKALRAVNPQGYVINAIKKHLSEHYGIVIEGGIILQDKKIAKKATVTRKEPTSLKDIFGGVDEQ